MNWADFPLTSGGRGLIQASAGTGKTWTIAVLYVRALLEGECVQRNGEPGALRPENILVATFTDAAAQELRERIRARVRDAIDMAETFIRGDEVVDPDLGGYLKSRWNAAESTLVKRDLIRLRQAWNQMDSAPIGTLHSTCARILKDYALIANASLVPGKAAAGSLIQREAVRDVWRELSMREPETLRGIGVNSARDFEFKIRPYLKPNVVATWQTSERISNAKKTLEQLNLPALLDSVRQLIAANPFMKTPGPVNYALAGMPETIETYLEGNAPSVWAYAEALTYEGLLSKVPKPLKTSVTDAYPLENIGRAAVALADLIEATKFQSLEQAIGRVRARLDESKRDPATQTFDGMVQDVADALNPEKSPATATALRDALVRRWPIALIDEFQDTDALQFEILDRIYARNDKGVSDGRLVMIGDPKQAIYAFRGGDLRVYARAAKSADAELRLTRNFRSSARILDGINAFHDPMFAGGDFGTSPSARDIKFETIEFPANISDANIPNEDVAMGDGLHFWICGESLDGEKAPTNKPPRVKAVLGACAAQIVRMINDPSLKIKGKDGLRRVSPGDIAVLLPAHHQVAQLQKMLAARGVPVVAPSRNNVFQSDAAQDLALFILAALEPGDMRRVRAALASPLAGFSLDELQALSADAHRVSEVQARAAEWARVFHEERIIGLVRHLSHEFQGSLQMRGNAERMLTDLRHLGELLQAQQQSGMSPGNFIAWMSQQSTADESSDKESVMRMESDESKVRLMTIHVSKGLEFEVVFLPTLWSRSKLAKADGVLTQDKGSTQWRPAIHDAEIEAGQSELLEEEYRLLYVAMTRAKSACHVFGYSTFKKTEFHSGYYMRLCRANWKEIEESFPQVIVHHGFPARSTQHYEPVATTASDLKEPLPVRTSRLAMDFQHSFSSITKGRAFIPETDKADPPVVRLDERDESLMPEEADDLLNQVRGPEFGVMLHGVLEEALHFEDGAMIALKVEEVMERERFALNPKWNIEHQAFVNRVVAMVKAVRDENLLRSGLRLQDVPESKMRPELTFQFKVDGVSLDAMAKLCVRHGEPDLIPSREGLRLQGYLKGAIDLTFEHDGKFYVLDYKGNWLGAKAEDYSPEAVAHAMADEEHHYRFQAFLYCLAIDRFLTRRLGSKYDRNEMLGGALYLFTRGVARGPGFGIWHGMFAPQLIDEANRLLGNDAVNSPEMSA